MVEEAVGVSEAGFEYAEWSVESCSTASDLALFSSSLDRVFNRSYWADSVIMLMV